MEWRRKVAFLINCGGPDAAGPRSTLCKLLLGFFPHVSGEMG